MDTGSCQASCIDRVYMCWQIGIDIGVSISIGADVYTNSDTLGGTVFSEAVPLLFLKIGSPKRAVTKAGAKRRLTALFWRAIRT